MAAVNRAASNFTMPALSPTMTEGNIASWKIKEGDSFSAGDVILEIETDKAQMDVEAQDDGILAKITMGDGSKAVKVGERIGVLAEEGDDLSTLEIPAEDKPSTSAQPARTDRPSPQEEAAGGLDKTETSPSAMEAPPSSKPNADAAAGGAADTARADQIRSDKSSSTSTSTSTRQNKKYPLYPSVHAMLIQNGLTHDDVSSIPATGPQGRLLKGDVLSYLGKIDKDYPASLSKSISKRGHLDLSNIQLAAPKKAEEKKAPAPEEAAKPEPTPDTEIALPVSLTAVLATQKRVEESLGIYLPLSTFIARASELANEDLPLSKKRTPTSDELFNSVLGLDQVIPKTSRGNYAPLISSFPSSSASAARPTKKTDIIDILSSKTSTPKKTPKSVGTFSGSHSVFSVMARNGEEKRVQEYLERVKTVLEAEPGRLIL